MKSLSVASLQSQLSEMLFESISKKTKKCHSHENGKLTKKQ